MSNQLRQQLDRLTAARSQAREARAALVKRAETEGRADLTPDETAKFRELSEKIDDLDERCSDAAFELQRSGWEDPAVQAVRGAIAGEQGGDGALNLDLEQLRAAHQALAHRGQFAMQVEQRAFSTVDSLLPPSLQPVIVGPVYENRLLTRLPIVSTEAPSIEYIRHTSTTGAPALVAEGAAKPELVLNTDKVIVQMEKIAAHTGVSWESLQDWPAFLSYVTGEVFREVVNVENQELLNGDGTTGHLTGILHTSGILTHATGSATALDSIESSIALLRNGAALAEPDLFVVSPNTWSAIRRSKDSQNRYLVTPNPLQDTAKSIWGVNTLVTTQIADGTAALIDTTKIGRVYVRQPLQLLMGWANDDFTRNITRFIGEERLNIAVERPAAVCSVTGLPTS